MAGISADLVRSLFRYDHETGVLSAAKSMHKWRAGVAVGCNKDGYRSVCIGGSRYRVHRVIWMLVHGRWPTHLIDHINGDRGDNRLANLREVDSRGNNQNHAKPKHNTSGLLGVSKSGRKDVPWYASISVNNKTIPLGRHKTKEEAFAAYLAGRARYFDTQPIPREILKDGTPLPTPVCATGNPYVGAAGHGGA